MDKRWRMQNRLLLLGGVAVAVFAAVADIRPISLAKLARIGDEIAARAWLEIDGRKRLNSSGVSFSCAVTTAA